MTESEWLKSTDPQAMFEFLRDGGMASERKLRLYLCGGCRRIMHLFYRAESSAAVEVAERFADGHATGEELHWAKHAAEVPTFGFDFDGHHRGIYAEDFQRRLLHRLVQLGAVEASALHGGEWCVNETVTTRLGAAANLAEYAASASFEATWGVRHLSLPDWPARWLFDCVFGNPFRAVQPGPAWLAWNDGALRKMAEAIYEERAFDRLPVLADALEDAGCCEQGLLDHLRGGGPHARGCYAIDLLSGKE